MPPDGTVAAEGTGPDEGARDDGVSKAGAPEVWLGTGGLSLEELCAVARGAPIRLTHAAREAMERSRLALQRHIEEGTPVYGVTCGVGALDRVSVDRAEGDHHQRSLLRSHAAGVGPALGDDVVRAMLASRLASFAQGKSAVGAETVDALVAMLRRGVVPVVPSLGFVGAADLAPLAHAALPLIGEGRARLDGKVLLGSQAMAEAGISLPSLGPRDGLALINGLSFSTAVAGLAVAEARALLPAIEAAVAMSLVAVEGATSSFDLRSTMERPHPGVIASASRIRALLELDEHAKPLWQPPLREHISLRAAHQVAGALQEATSAAVDVLSVELGAPSDNPLVCGSGFTSSNVANFDGHRLALACDHVSGALLMAAAASERRIARLLDPAHSRGLPAFLIHPDAVAGVSSGWMIGQYTAAALVAELRAHAGPVAGSTLPTCNGTEDVVSMAPVAARRLRAGVETLRQILAIELLCAAQALDLRTFHGGRLAPAPVAAWHRSLRAEVPVLVEDRELGADIERVAAWLADDAGGCASPGAGQSDRMVATRPTSSDSPSAG